MRNDSELSENGSEMFHNHSSRICPMTTADQMEFLFLSSFLLEGVVQMMICVLGILGNIASIFILTRPQFRSCFNQLLAVLASYDFLYLLTMMLESMKRLGAETNTQILLFPFLLFPLNYIAMTGSIFMTVCVAIERYIAVSHPLYYHKILQDTTTHRGRLLAYLIPVTILAVLFNIPKFFEIQVVEDEEGNIFTDITAVRTNHFYITYYHNWFRLLAIGILPFAAILVLNIKIYLAMRRRRNGRRNQDDLSVILIVIVTTFVICNFPRLVLNMHETFVVDVIHLCQDSLLGGFPIWSIFSGFLSHVLLVINSSANLFIYCSIGTKFRHHFCNLLHSCSCLRPAPRDLEQPECVELLHIESVRANSTQLNKTTVGFEEKMTLHHQLPPDPPETKTSTTTTTTITTKTK